MLVETIVIVKVIAVVELPFLMEVIVSQECAYYVHLLLHLLLPRLLSNVISCAPNILNLNINHMTLRSNNLSLPSDMEPSTHQALPPS